MAAQADDRPVALVGGGEDVIHLAKAVRRMRAGQPAQHPELVAFKDWADGQDHVEHDRGGLDLAVTIRLIDKYGPDVRRVATHVRPH